MTRTGMASRPTLQPLTSTSSRELQSPLSGVSPTSQAAYPSVHAKVPVVRALGTASRDRDTAVTSPQRPCVPVFAVTLGRRVTVASYGVGCLVGAASGPTRVITVTGLRRSSTPTVPPSETGNDRERPAPSIEAMPLSAT